MKIAIGSLQFQRSLSLLKVPNPNSALHDKLIQLRPGNDQSNRPSALVSTPSPSNKKKELLPLAKPRQHMFPQSNKTFDSNKVMLQMNSVPSLKSYLDERQLLAPKISAFDSNKK